MALYEKQQVFLVFKGPEVETARVHQVFEYIEHARYYCENYRPTKEDQEQGNDKLFIVGKEMIKGMPLDKPKVSV
jgi:hypothetical protein